MGSMSSGMTYATGSCSDDGKTFTLLSRETDPMTRETTDLKDVIRIEDDDHHSFTRYYALPDGTFEKGVEIAYTRKD
jgi:hypothetical protein